MTYVTKQQRRALRKKKIRLFKKYLFVIIVLGIIGVSAFHIITKRDYATELTVPSYQGQPYIEVNGNVPYFEEEEMITTSFEKYSELDYLGRCGVAYANLSRETMPTEKRGEIGMIKPSGWQSVKYPEVIDDLYLYNRCHLIAWCLSGENANEKNLITGTRYMNIEGMLFFEEKVARYIEETDHHVLYRVTPVFESNNLVASGVLIEALSVEDKGAGISFCVYCFNIQPGIEIDYRSGESKKIFF